LDGSKHRALGEGGARFGQLDVDHVSELPLRVVGDPDLNHRRVARRFDVLMFGGIGEVGGNVGHCPWSVLEGVGKSRRRLSARENAVKARGWNVWSARRTPLAPSVRGP